MIFPPRLTSQIDQMSRTADDIANKMIDDLRTSLGAGVDPETVWATAAIAVREALEEGPSTTAAVMATLLMRAAQA